MLVGAFRVALPVLMTVRGPERRVVARGWGGVTWVGVRAVEGGCGGGRSWGGMGVGGGGGAWGRGGGGGGGGWGGGVGGGGGGGGAGGWVSRPGLERRRRMARPRAEAAANWMPPPLMDWTM